MSKNISKKIKEARKLKKITLKKLSEITGVSVGHLSEFENDKTGIESEKLFSICRALGVEMVSEDHPPAYGVTKVMEGLTPDEAVVLRIIRECPEALSVVQMMGAMDRDTQKRVQDRVEEQKLMQDMKKAMNK